MMMSFERARVKATFMRRQSLISSPSYREPVSRQYVGTYEALIEVTHLSIVARAHHRDNDTLLVSSLTTVRRHNLKIGIPLLFVQKVREQFDLLSVRSDDCQLVLSHAALNKCINDLVDERALDFVLEEVTNAGVSARNGVCIDENGIGASRRYNIRGRLADTKGALARTSRPLASPANIPHHHTRSRMR